MTTRRTLLQSALSGLALAGSGVWAVRARAGLPQGTLDSSRLESLPGKQPLLKRSFRPPNYETPVAAFNDLITPNDRFFVRWHLANIPQIDPQSWRLVVDGDAVAQSLELSLAELRSGFEPVELVAVCQCSGNRRGLSDPHVPGVEWGYGAMGNARWRGVRLKDILSRAGIKKEAVEIAFNGNDRSPIEATPRFVKSIPTWKALDENTMIAYEMNGAPLPHWNGFPARLIVPGWTGTYWMKQVVSIRALSEPLNSFWMNTAYRIPKGKFPVVDRFVSQESDSSTPITEILVNSLITSHVDGQRVAAGTRLVIAGIAWDNGAGIRRVEVSIDGGSNWTRAELGADLGRFSFRPWVCPITPNAKGPILVMACASNAQGSSQTFDLIFNGPGYHNNVVQRLALEIV